MPIPGKIEVESKEARVSTLPESLKNELAKKMGELVELSDSQKKRIKKWLKTQLDDWKNDTSTLHNDLIDDNDLIEGRIAEIDFPFEGASNTHMHIPEIFMSIYKSTQRRSILGANKIWYGELEPAAPKALQEEFVGVEDQLNFKARNEWNIEQALEDVFHTTDRDGLGIMQVTWEETFKKSRDIVLISNEQEFIDEFVSPEEAGLKQEEWNDLIQMIKAEASDDEPVEIPISFEKEVYRGNRGEVIDLIDFVIFPASCKDIRDMGCRGYGKMFDLRKESIKKKARDKVFYQDAVDKVVKKEGTFKVDEYRAAQDDIEGITRSNTKGVFRLFEGKITGKIDGLSSDGEEEDFLVTYSHEHDELLQVIHFPYRRDHYALFHIDRRPNRLIGRSIPLKTRNISDEMDTLHNQRINVRDITSVPSFKARKTNKKGFDPNAEEHRWGVGKILWVENPEDFTQFAIQPTDLGESLQEEANDFRILDLLLGASSSVISGLPDPSNPDAPGNKTAIQIAQSNLRMDNPLNQLRPGVEEVGEICLSHQFQFDRPIIQFQKQISGSDGTQTTETRSIHKKVLRRGFKPKMAGVTVVNNPEFEMRRLIGLYVQLLQEPTFAQNPKLRMEVLRDALRAGREPGRNRYLPSDREIEAEAVRIQKLAIQQLQAEEEAREKEELDARIQKANQGLRIDSLGEKTAGSNIEEVA
jgi:hypothetical protein